MAKFRLVHTSFWNDPRVVEEMTAEDKYFFLYLLTNEATSQVGIYQITKRQMAFDLGYSTESVNALMQRFIDHHKIVRYNSETREIAIKNWGKYNLVRGGKPIIDCVKSELKNVKDTTFIEYVGEGIPNESIRNVYVTYYDTLTIREENEESSNTNGSYVSSTIRWQEQQQQQDKQQEKEQQQEKEKEKQQDKEVGQSVNHFSQLVNFYEQNIGILRPVVREELDYILDKYKDVDLIIKALTDAVINPEVRNKVRYAEGTLRNWQAELITTFEQLKVKEANERGRNGTGYGKATSEVPSIIGNRASSFD